MSSELVSADPNDVKKLANDLKKFQDKIKDVNKQAQRAIDNANWNDAQKEKFKSNFREFNRQVEGFVNGRVSDFVMSLTKMAADLEKAKSHKF